MGGIKANLQLKGFLGGVVQTEQTEAIVPCDPRSLALGTCEGPPPIQETETRVFSAGLGINTNFSLYPPKSSFQFYPQAGAHLYFYPFDFTPAFGGNLRHIPSRVDGSAQLLYGLVTQQLGGLVGLDWQPMRDSGFQLGGHFLYKDGPGFYFSAAWRFDFTSN